MTAALPAAAEETPAIRALGPRFKLTKVFLRDDAVVDFWEASARRDGFTEKLTNICACDADSNVGPSGNDYTSVEDLELARQMDALGLPISFSTAGEKRNIGAVGKRKGTKMKSSSSYRDSENRFSGLSKAGEWEDITSSIVLSDSTNIHSCCNTTIVQTEVSYNDYQGAKSHSDGEPINLAASIFCEKGRKQVSDENSTVTLSNSVCREPKSEDDLERDAEVLKLATSLDAERPSRNDLEDASCLLYHAGTMSNKEDEASFLESSPIPCHKSSGRDNDVDSSTSELCSNLVVSSISCYPVGHKAEDCPENSLCYEFGEWKVAWDAFYMRYYFYNCHTQESTWFPPPGLEHFGHLCRTTSTVDMIADANVEDSGLGLSQKSIEDQNVFGLRDSTSQQDKSYERVNSSSEEVSSKNKACVNGTDISMSGLENPDTNCESEFLDQHVEIEQEQLDVSECLVTQKDGCTQPKACVVPENFFKFYMENSAAITLNELGRRDNSTADPFETYAATCVMDELDSHQRHVTRKKNRGVRSPQSYLVSQEVNAGVSAKILKYWCQRYLLFSQFDKGIKMDEEGWFSVTPESIARHHASRCGSGTVIDCFSGVGGNAIQFAMKSNHVIAIDIDPQKIDYAQENAAVYGVKDKIDFVIADFFQVAPQLKGDTVFLSPPWGGPDYSKVQIYNMATMLQPHDGYSLFKIAKVIAPKIVMFLPRNVDLNQLAELALLASPSCALEVEKNYLNGKLKAITAYFDITELRRC